MNLTLRAASASDVNQLLALGLVSFGIHRTVLTEDNWLKLQNGLSDECRYIDLLSKAKCFVCENDSTIVGMAFLVSQGNPTEVFAADWCYLRMVGVSPEYSGQGIARRLTQMCLDYARSTNEKTVALHTAEFMDAARHIYESLGFIRVREIPSMFGKKYWLYRLDL